jgi:hypothetical protein
MIIQHPIAIGVVKDALIHGILYPVPLTIADNHVAEWCFLVIPYSGFPVPITIP